jgi:N-acyl-D-amino-acid deacylase
MMVLLPERNPLDLDAIDFVMAELAPPDGIIFTHFPAEA